MVKLTEKEKEFLKEHFPYKKELLTTLDVDDILTELNTLILEIGFDEEYRLTDIGRKAQRMYDNIYNNN
ncbi:hypothetical protein [Paraclostridium sordellii]|uniref:hypothetical protein n=1 Tax=Paraclostridium sordellii TaxID=1505 RepID=UPI0005E7CDE1|nr:hypothetical protein [Paeniclostridium sordellii]CEQ14839.1 Uncharacterised protein [[Clostridium] sordellii] [Paeniclostridium sordellii]